MSEINESGVIVDGFQEARAALVTDLKTVFGEGANFDASTRLGQLANIVAERIADQNELIMLLAGAQNPDGAFGVWLDMLARLAGVTRNGARKSTVALTLVTANERDVVVPAGSIVANSVTGAEFTTDHTVLVPAGTTLGMVSATAVDEGAFEGDSGQITKIKTPVFGWASAHNVAAVVPGRLAETDVSLRRRYRVALARVGGQSLSAVYLALSNVEGVSRVFVHENAGSSADEHGAPPHSLWAVVGGGSTAAIAAALFGARPAGVATFGTSSVLHFDPVSGRNYTVSFGRPVEQLVHVRVRVRRLATYPADGDQRIKEAILAWFDGGLPMGDPFIPSRIMDAVNSVPGHAVLEVGGRLVSFDPWSAAPIPMSPDRYANSRDYLIAVEVVP